LAVAQHTWVYAAFEIDTRKKDCLPSVEGIFMFQLATFRQVLEKSFRSMYLTEEATQVEGLGKSKVPYCALPH